jgi:hypothetical protein
MGIDEARQDQRLAMVDDAGRRVVGAQPLCAPNRRDRAVLDQHRASPFVTGGGRRFALERVAQEGQRLPEK